MTKTTITRLIVYFIFIGLPILAMMNCSGWGANDGTVDNCFFDGNFFRIIANFLYNTVYFSAFFLAIPIVLYIFIVNLLARSVKDEDFYPSTEEKINQIKWLEKEGSLTKEEATQRLKKIKDNYTEEDINSQKLPVKKKFNLKKNLYIAISIFTIYIIFSWLTQKSETIILCDENEIFTKNFSSTTLWFRKRPAFITRYDTLMKYNEEFKIGYLNGNKIISDESYISKKVKECINSSQVFSFDSTDNKME